MADRAPRPVADFAIEDAASGPVLGRLAARGLHDELGGEAYAVIDGLDGRVHHLRFTDLEATGDTALGGIVETRAWTRSGGGAGRALVGRSDLSIEAQVTAQGATWLDRLALARNRAPLEPRGLRRRGANGAGRPRRSSRRPGSRSAAGPAHRLRPRSAREAARGRARRDCCPDRDRDRPAAPRARRRRDAHRDLSPPARPRLRPLRDDRGDRRRRRPRLRARALVAAARAASRAERDGNASCPAAASTGRPAASAASGSDAACADRYATAAGATPGARPVLRDGRGQLLSDRHDRSGSANAGDPDPLGPDPGRQRRRRSASSGRATQWTAWRLGYQPQLGPPWFELVGMPVYPPAGLLLVVVLSTTPMRRASSSRARCIAGVRRLRRHRASRSACRSGARARPRHVATYGSARWATRGEVAAAGLLGPDGVVLGRLDARLPAP